MFNAKCGYVPASDCTKKSSCNLLEAIGTDEKLSLSWWELQRLAMMCEFLEQPPAEKIITITDSRRFKNCRIAWLYSSRLGYSLVPLSPNKNLWLGRGVHKALAGWYGQGKVLAQAFEEWFEGQMKELSKDDIERLDSEVELGRAMLAHYELWAPIHDDFDVVRTEIKFRVPLTQLGAGIYFMGMCDGLIKADDGVWLLEHKTASQWPDFSLLPMDSQGAGYIWASKRDPAFVGIEPRGVIYNFLRKKIPKVPTVTQHGLLERRANMSTSYEIYLSEIRRLGHSVEHYEEMLNTLKGKDEFFKRVRVKFPASRLEVFESDLLKVGREMISDPAIYPTESWYFTQCPACPFLVACQLLMHGSDPMEYLKSSFKVAEDYLEESEVLE